jgi:hypothetical protein
MPRGIKPDADILMTVMGKSGEESIVLFGDLCVLCNTAQTDTVWNVKAGKQS